jgi:hypothetical protein
MFLSPPRYRRFVDRQNEQPSWHETAVYAFPVYSHAFGISHFGVSRFSLSRVGDGYLDEG